MTILNSIQSNVNSLSNKIRNPFDVSVSADFDKPDFPDGFVMEEILSNGRIGDKVVLAGNWMPKIPFTFGGSQRIKKEFYSGYSEPTVQVFGPEEDDLTINGLFKDKRFSDPKLKNISTEIQQQIDAIRIRGNVVKLRLGEFERYAILVKTKFDMERLSRVGYSITFSVIGFNAPKNARFLQSTKEVPFGINKDLIALATELNLIASTIPDTVPRSIADQITSLTSVVAGAISTITGFVDTVFATVNDIKSAVNRVKGMIAYAQQQLNKYKRQLGSITSFDPAVTIAARYTSAKYSSSSISFSSSMTSLLEKLRASFSGLVNDLPLGRHLVVTSDTLQKIAIKFYGSSNDWKKIYDYNNLSSTNLTVGTILDIPRV